MNVEHLSACLRSQRFAFQDEAELQDAIAAVFQRDGIGFEREVRLSPKDRIDFMVAPAGTGIEVKIDRSISEITRQLHRYAGLPQISGLVLVTTKMRLANLPAVMNGKPIRSVMLMTGIG